MTRTMFLFAQLLLINVSLYWFGVYAWIASLFPSKLLSESFDLTYTLFFSGFTCCAMVFGFLYPKKSDRIIRMVQDSLRNGIPKRPSLMLLFDLVIPRREQKLLWMELEELKLYWVERHGPKFGLLVYRGHVVRAILSVIGAPAVKFFSTVKGMVWPNGPS